MVKSPPADAGDVGSIPDPGRSLRAAKQLSPCAQLLSQRSELGAAAAKPG